MAQVGRLGPMDRLDIEIQTMELLFPSQGYFPTDHNELERLREQVNGQRERINAIVNELLNSNEVTPEISNYGARIIELNRRIKNLSNVIERHNVALKARHNMALKPKGIFARIFAIFRRKKKDIETKDIAPLGNGIEVKPIQSIQRDVINKKALGQFALTCNKKSFTDRIQNLAQPTGVWGMESCQDPAVSFLIFIANADKTIREIPVEITPEGYIVPFDRLPKAPTDVSFTHKICATFEELRSALELNPELSISKKEHNEADQRLSQRKALIACSASVSREQFCQEKDGLIKVLKNDGVKGLWAIHVAEDRDAFSIFSVVDDTGEIQEHKGTVTAIGYKVGEQTFNLAALKTWYGLLEESSVSTKKIAARKKELQDAGGQIGEHNTTNLLSLDATQFYTVSITDTGKLKIGEEEFANIVELQASHPLAPQTAQRLVPLKEDSRFFGSFVNQDAINTYFLQKSLITNNFMKTHVPFSGIAYNQKEGEFVLCYLKKQKKDGKFSVEFEKIGGSPGLLVFGQGTSFFDTVQEYIEKNKLPKDTFKDTEKRREQYDSLFTHFSGSTYAESEVGPRRTAMSQIGTELKAAATGVSFLEVCSDSLRLHTLQENGSILNQQIFVEPNGIVEGGKIVTLSSLQPLTQTTEAQLLKDKAQIVNNRKFVKGQLEIKSQKLSSVKALLTRAINTMGAYAEGMRCFHEDRGVYYVSFIKNKEIHSVPITFSNTESITLGDQTIKLDEATKNNLDEAICKQLQIPLCKYTLQGAQSRVSLAQSIEKSSGFTTEESKKALDAFTMRVACLGKEQQRAYTWYKEPGEGQEGIFYLLIVDKEQNVKSIQFNTITQNYVIDDKTYSYAAQQVAAVRDLLQLVQTELGIKQEIALTPLDTLEVAHRKQVKNMELEVRSGDSYKMFVSSTQAAADALLQTAKRAGKTSGYLFRRKEGNLKEDSSIFAAFTNIYRAARGYADLAQWGVDVVCQKIGVAPKTEAQLEHLITMSWENSNGEFEVKDIVLRIDTINKKFIVSERFDAQTKTFIKEEKTFDILPGAIAYAVGQDTLSLFELEQQAQQVRHQETLLTHGNAFTGKALSIADEEAARNALKNSWSFAIEQGQTPICMIAKLEKKESIPWKNGELNCTTPLAIPDFILYTYDGEAIDGQKIKQFPVDVRSSPGELKIGDKQYTSLEKLIKGTVRQPIRSYEQYHAQYRAQSNKQVGTNKTWTETAYDWGAYFTTHLMSWINAKPAIQEIMIKGDDSLSRFNAVYSDAQYKNPTGEQAIALLFAIAGKSLSSKEMSKKEIHNVVKTLTKEVVLQIAPDKVPVEKKEEGEEKMKFYNTLKTAAEKHIQQYAAERT